MKPTDPQLERHNQLIAATVRSPRPKLPYWPDNVRGITNGILRSSLFGIVKKGERSTLDRSLIASQSGVEIRYTGLRLDQLDMEVWEHLIHIARNFPLGNKVHFSANDILKALGRANGKSQHEWFKGCVNRLKATAVEIKYNRKAYIGSLLQDCYRDDISNSYVVIMNPNMIYLYDTHEWTGLQADVRLALKGKPLALWLHGYYSSHTSPYPIKTNTLYTLSGASYTEMRFFKRDLLKSCEKLSEVTGWKFEMKNDLLHVKK